MYLCCVNMIIVFAREAFKTIYEPENIGNHPDASIHLQNSSRLGNYPLLFPSLTQIMLITHYAMFWPFACPLKPLSILEEHRAFPEGSQKGLVKKAGQE